MVSSHKNIKSNDNYLVWCANNFGYTKDDIDFYVDESALKSDYTKIDWENETVTEDGLITNKPVN